MLDEAQFIRDWGTWVKHQVDFNKQRRIAFTGSAMPLVEAGQESGVGRWHTIRLTTLSFYEYLQIKNLSLPALPRLKSLRDLFDWPQSDFYRVTEAAAPYVGHFHEYLVRGGFPQTAQVESITQAQRLLREDIIDKVLKRDMTALFGVRRVLDLEHTFLYLICNFASKAGKSSGEFHIPAEVGFLMAEVLQPRPGCRSATGPAARAASCCSASATSKSMAATCVSSGCTAKNPTSPPTTSRAPTRSCTVAPCGSANRATTCATRATAQFAEEETEPF